MQARSPRSRWRGLDPFVFDSVVAGLFLLAAIIDVVLIAEPPASDSRLVPAIAFSVPMALGLALRRRAVWAMIVVVFGSMLAIELIADYMDGLSVAFVAMLWVFYSIGRWADPVAAPAIVGMAGAIGVLVAVAGVAQTAAGGFLFLAPVFVGVAVRRRGELNTRLRSTVSRIESNRQTDAENAVGAERERIAGELQAVVANGVSVIVAQSEAVPRLIAAGERESAGASLAVIEETGRDALAEMRRLLGVLRRDGEAADRRPLPSLAALEDLIGRFEAEGLRAEIVVDGERRELSPGVELAGYRVVEWALSDALAANAGGVEVRVSFGERELDVSVSDDRHPDAERPDTASIGERVRIYDGVLRTGALGSRHSLRARLPIGAAA